MCIRDREDSMNKISVAVVDDNEKIVETICNELERDEEINIVGKAKNGEEAFDIIKKTNPDVVVLDLIMPKMDGLSLMNKIHKDGSIIKPVSYTHLDVYKRQEQW